MLAKMKWAACAGKVPPARFLFSLAFYTETVQSEGTHLAFQ